ncbi:uncharacterized protein IWZ02DRAFT_14540 [Phyllosticta citriasiana]|uniref:uncharacterized protein n=1 Tax=Phyllosticta citriasiana TaxID=595635 RepID=UPI0030FDD83D
MVFINCFDAEWQHCYKTVINIFLTLSSFDAERKFCGEVIPVMLEKQTTTEFSNLKKVLERARKKELCAAASLKYFASQKNGHRFVLPQTSTPGGVLYTQSSSLPREKKKKKIYIRPCPLSIALSCEAETPQCGSGPGSRILLVTSSGEDLIPYSHEIHRLVPPQACPRSISLKALARTLIVCSRCPHRDSRKPHEPIPGAKARLRGTFVSLSHWDDMMLIRCIDKRCIGSSSRAQGAWPTARQNVKRS